MGPGDYEFLRDLLKQRSGLVLTPDKTYLIETRLLPLAHRHGFANLDDFITRLRSSGDRMMAKDVTEAMATHESLFFRDRKPFDFFQNTVLPALKARRHPKKSFRIWCAASSSGQEPYSLAMLIKETGIENEGWRAEITATDISHEILDRAARGLYTQFEVQRGLPVNMLVKYFTQIDDTWQISTEIRDMVRFQHFNLLENPAVLGKFDVVFCRNVLIYFDVETKRQVLSNICDILADDGVLFLGGAESTFSISDRFEVAGSGRGVYRKTECTASLADDVAPGG